MSQLRSITTSLLTSAACLLILTASSLAEDTLRGLQLPDEIAAPTLSAISTDEPPGLFVQVPRQTPKGASLLGNEAMVSPKRNINEFGPKTSLQIKVPKKEDVEVTGSISLSIKSGPQQTRMFGHSGSNFAAAELQMIVATSLDNSDRVKAALADEDAASVRVWRAWAAFAPVINATAFVGTQPSSSNLATSPSETGRTLTFSGRVGILDGGQRYYGVKSALSTARAAASEVRSTRERVALETINAVLERDFSAHQANILRQTVANLQQLVTVAQSRMQAGLASNSDVTDVQAELADAQRILVSAEASENKARVTLEGLMGGKAPQGLILPNLDRIARNGEMALVTQSAKSNPTIQSAWHRFDAADYNSRAAWGRYLPKLDLLAEHKTSRGFNSSNGNGWTVGAQLTMPLVELTTVADIAESRFTAQAARYRAQDRVREIQTQVSVDWQEFNSTTSKISLARRKLAALKSGLVSKQEQYRVGLIPVDQLLTQTRKVAQAQIEYVEARSGRYAALVRIASSAGILEETLKQPTPDNAATTGSIKAKAPKVESAKAKLPKQNIVQSEPDQKPVSLITAAR